MFNRYLLNAAATSNRLACASRRGFASVKVGDVVPSAKVSVVQWDGKGFSNEIMDTSDFFSGKRVVLVGYPGAFTPTCEGTHLPEYIADAQRIKKDGTHLVSMAVNDPFVISAFAMKLGGEDKMTYIADGNGDFTKALGLDFDLSAVQLGHIRTKRMSMIVDDCKIVEFNNEDGPGLTETSACSTILKQMDK